MRGEVRPVTRVAAFLAALAALAACGPPTPEDLAREGLLRQRAEASRRGAKECAAACDSARALLDAGVPVESAGVAAARQVCARAGIL